MDGASIAQDEECLSLKVDYLLERLEDLESLFETERSWYRDRVEWFIQWYNEQQVEFEGRIEEKLEKDLALKELHKEMYN